MHNYIVTQHNILYVIIGVNTPYGLVIEAELEEYFKVDVNHGRLYSNLNTLIEKNLTEKGDLDKRTNVYTLAGEGERHLRRVVSALMREAAIAGISSIRPTGSRSLMRSRIRSLVSVTLTSEPSQSLASLKPHHMRRKVRSEHSKIHAR